MSGGHWQYQSYRIEEDADRAYTGLTALAEIEHVLDWGYSGDTCAACAELEALKKLCDYFDGRAHKDAGHTWGERETRCPDCIERDRKHAEWKAAHP